MNTDVTNRSTSTLIATAAACLLMAGCSAGLTKPDGADSARSKLTALQANPELASRAPVAIKEAEVAVRAAEVPRADDDLARHLVVMADRKVEIATAQAQSRLLVDQRIVLSQQRETARLDSRTREADKARGEADMARTDADIARDQASAARADAELARTQADAARGDSEDAQRKAEELERQIAALNAKATDRGLVVTLGDLLFATGKSELKGGAANNLEKLAVFLTTYPDRTVIIEGHTDSVGSEVSNQNLSQQRANSVRNYLVGRGIAQGRLSASGMGEGSPVAGNESPTGRQQNRRVEVIIANTVASAR